jgi:hypothetical protein
VANKYAIENMPSLPHVNLIGSLITGSHGGGITLKALANYAQEIRFMNPKGEMKVSSIDTDVNFKKHLHAFGTTGPITQVGF